MTSESLVMFREFLRNYESGAHIEDADLSDDELQKAIDDAQAAAGSQPITWEDAFGYLFRCPSIRAEDQARCTLRIGHDGDHQVP